MRSGALTIAFGFLLAMTLQPATAESKYGPGVTDTEIKLGQTMPYSGPVSSFGLIGRVEKAYFNMINAQGGVNGRRVTLLSLDDAFSPSKTVEQIRALVEGEQVLAVLGSMGSAPNLAIARYLNNMRVPQILAAAGSSKLVDPVNFPWTTTFYSSSRVEAGQVAKYLLETKPDAKVGVIYQTDESGKVYLDGFRAALGAHAATMIVREIGFDLSSPTIDSQILQLKASDADTVFFATPTPKFGAQGIRKIGELNWKPLLLLTPGVSLIDSVLTPAGLQNAVGAITPIFLKYPDDPQWQSDPAMMDYYAFMKTWAPGEPAREATAIIAYTTAQMGVELLKRCGNELTRENLIYQATHVSDLQLPLFLPGVKINVTPEQRVPWTQARMARFNGTSWVFISDPIAASAD